MAVSPLDLEALAPVAKTIRFLAADAVQAANSGHPGMPMGCADLASVLWARHLRFDPADPDWMGRDRFILSAGHGCMLQYALLHLFGFDLPMEEIRNFRQYGSKTPGHPERGHTPGVEVTTGPLGQGIANGAGMALAARMASARFAGEGFDPFDQRVYVLAGDGCMMEGVGYEAASLAGHLRLSNLIVLYDSNRITIDGGTDLAFSENVAERYQSFGFDIQRVDGHDMAAVDAALEKAKRTGTPSLIICDTHIAFGAPTKHDTAGSHGAPLGDDEIAAMRKELDWPEEKFHVPASVRVFGERVAAAKTADRAAWDEAFGQWKTEDEERAARYDAFVSRRLPDDLFDALAAKAPSKADATRGHGGVMLQAAAELIPAVVGGSADLASSNKTVIKNGGAVSAADFTGRNIHFGVREHGMAAMANGMAAFGGWRPFVATFLVFADYMRPAIRLASIMRVPTLFIFTHDSFQVGEDGPTHQPIEHLESLRAIPGLRVLRPADAEETAGAYFSALQYDGPTAIVLTRQKLPLIERADGYALGDILRGAQVLRSSDDDRATIVATGSEVWVALEAAKILEDDGFPVRVVSMVCREKFLARPAEEQAKIVPPDRPTAAIEAGATAGWTLMTGRYGLRIGLDRFGASAPDTVLHKQFGFAPESVARKVKSWLTAKE